MKSLPLKYRPQQLSDLVGQEFIKKTLENALTAKLIAPAYLFAGPRGTGKTSTARILAKSLNCLAKSEPTTKPCGECSSCRSIECSNAIDVTEIDAASHNGIDHARELVELSHLTPAQVRYKVFIIDECHGLTTAAQNALLKLLEEPPARTIFILCTTELHKVLPTITSRCQLFNFKSLSLNTVVERLREIAATEKIDINPQAQKAIAKFSLGSLRDSLQLLSQLRLLEQKITPERVIEAVGGISPQDLWQLMVSLAREEVLQALEMARKLTQAGKSPQLILTDLLNCYRDLLLFKATQGNCQSLLASNLAYLAPKMDFDRINSNLEQLQQKENQLRFSTNNAVWLETCLLNMMSSTSVVAIKPNTNHHKSAIKPEKRALNQNLRTVWAKIVASTKPTNRGLLSRASLIGLDRERKFAVLAVESEYVTKFRQNANTLSRIITQGLNQQQPIDVVIEEKS